MKRRDFLAATALAATVPMFQQARADDKPTGNKQTLELRHYEFATAEKQTAFEVFLAKAFIPALKPTADQPPSASSAMQRTKDQPGLWVLIPHNSFESVTMSNSKILADSGFMQAGGETLSTPMKKPAYTRFQSSLLLAF